MINKNDIENIRRIPISRLLGIRETGRRYAIRCPFHSRDSTPSLAIYPDQSFYCYGCQKHGANAIDFIMLLGSSFSEAVEELKKYI